MITRQKIYSVLCKAGYHAAQFHRSGMVRGWGSWTSGVEVKECMTHNGAGWQVQYNFGDRNAKDAQRVERLQSIQKVLLAAGIECFPDENEYALIVAPFDS